MLGFIVIAIGIQTMINTQLGLNPWGIFHSGLAHTTGITFGRASQLTGLSIILLCLTFKIFPGIGTVLNMIFIGLLVDLVAHLDFLPHYNGLILNMLSFLSGNFLFALGVFIYLYADLGSGPRDSLMLALTRTTRFTAGQCKIMMEITVAIIGILLGGSAGLGTVLAAFSGGLFIDLVFKFFKYNPKNNTPTSLLINYQEIKTIRSQKSV
jgi:uncharacterized membrane protein YczE